MLFIKKILKIIFFLNSKSPEVAKRKGKLGTKWENEGSSKDTATLDYTPGTDQGELVLSEAEVSKVYDELVESPCMVCNNSFG